VVANQFSGRLDPFGGGVIIGYNFAPWANSVIVSLFAPFDFLRQPHLTRREAPSTKKCCDINLPVSSAQSTGCRLHIDRKAREPSLIVSLQIKVWSQLQCVSLLSEDKTIRN
jgi:hypothetical protein